MSYDLTISIPCMSEGMVQLIIDSLSPEMKHQMPKADIQLSVKKSILFLKISTDDISTLRAATNSYVRWIETAINVHQIV